MHRSLIFLLMALFMAPAAADAVRPAPTVQPYSATYEIHRGRMRIGTMRTELVVPAEGPWTYRSSSETAGLAALLRDVSIQEVSTFVVTDDARVMPLYHGYEMTGDRRHRDFSLEFDWDTGIVSGTVRGEEISEPLEEGTVDRHAMAVAVMLERAAGKTYPRVHTMIDRGRVRALTTTMEDGGTVETGAGAFETTMIVQQRMDDPTRRYRMWVADTADGPVLVRLQSVDDEGADITITLTRLEP
jgi:hypothetical protein